MFDLASRTDVEACELTLRGTPLGATTGRSQASASFSSSVGLAAELAGLVRPQGCAPAQPAASPAGGPVATRSPVIASTPWEDHEFRNPSTRARSNRKQRRSQAYELRDGLRACSVKRVAGCGRRRISHDVEVVRRRVQREYAPSYQRAYYRGLLSCGSVWECPVCASQIRAERATELQSAVEAWGPSCVAMLSLTVRHGLGDDLRAVRAGVANSFRRVINGVPWKRFSSKFGLKHSVRALEVTHGALHGWHPHLHVLLFFEKALDEQQSREAIAWLSARWAECVRRALGDGFTPNDHGVDLRASRRSDYLIKSVWELVDPGSKRGRVQNRTPLQIAADVVKLGEPADVALWKSFCSGMRGAKMLTWSRGMRAALGIGTEKPDEVLVEGEEQAEAETVAVIDGCAWDRVRDRRGLACAILEAAELAPSAAACFEALRQLMRGPERSRCGPSDAAALSEPDP